jgi:hypothetical protein
MENNDTIFGTPKDLAKFKGQFIVFFSEDIEPEVLFSSFIAEEAYKRAEEIEKEQGRKPVVIRIQENLSNNIAQVLAMRF